MELSIRKLCEKGDDCKQTGVANCEGCSKVFCTKHFADHRHLLGEQMNAIMGEYNNFKNKIIQEPDYSNIQTLIQEVINWEEESTKKIKQKSADLQLQLSQLKTTHLHNISTELQSSVEQIQKGLTQDDFIEKDIGRCQEKLNDLKSKFPVSSMIIIKKHNDISLVEDVSTELLSAVTSELFDRAFNDNVRIDDGGKLVVSVKFFMNYTEIRGKNSYASGYHKIRLQIEHASNEWTFLGINNKLVPLQALSFTSKSAYGWCNSNYVYSKGTYDRNKTDQPVQMSKNDIITLTFDCDSRKISMINETTNAKYELIVDTDNCPFPWQLHVILRSVDSRIRILPA